MLTSFELFTGVLERKFRDLGLNKIRRGEWFLENHHTAQVLDLKKPWNALMRVSTFIRGKRVLIAIAWTGSRHVHGLSTTKPIIYLYAVPKLQIPEYRKRPHRSSMVCLSSMKYFGASSLKGFAQRKL